ncbi:MAG: hypothetical protein ACRCZF_01545, partial [Gemmataceae bacterium]
MLTLIAIATVLAAPPAPPADTLAALKPLAGLVGSWKGTGFPEGTRAERDAGLWSETQSWSWNLANNSAALMATIEKGKHASK